MTAQLTEVNSNVMKRSIPTGIEPVRLSYKKVVFLGFTEVMNTITDGCLTIVI